MLLPTAFLVLYAIPSARSQCSGGIPASEVAGFLTSHNRLRQTISAGNYNAKGRWMPPAKIPIPNLVWDCGLEKSAQSVANACRLDHSEYARVFGENLFLSTGSFAGQGRAASDDWESALQEYEWPGVKLTRAMLDSGVGHATQMAWAKTTKMGCGMAMCQGKRRVLVVCHYLEAGNYIGQNVYEPVSATPDNEIIVDVGDDTGETVANLFKNWFDLE